MRSDDAGALVARPRPARARRTAPSGLLPLNESGAPPALLYVPPGLDPAVPAPFVAAFHGAGGVPQHALDLARAHLDAFGGIFLAPASQASTWDMIAGRRFGPDVETLDALLARVFEDHAVDPGRVALAGFSDGASYALSLGLMNGRLVSRILAFSPGFVAPLRTEGRPAVFISHGEEDQVLPIDRCSRRLVRQLERRYEVQYVEFAGGHEVPPDVARRAFAALA